MADPERGGEVARRDKSAAILEAVRLAAERFLDRSQPWVEHAPEVLRSLLEATDTSRVYLFENYRWDDDGEVWATQRIELSAPGVRSIGDSEALAALPMRVAGFGRWIDRFRDGQPVHGLRRELPPEEQRQLAEDDTLSIAVVPLVVDGEWWGMVGFDECAYERRWSDEEIDGLRAAAGVIAAAISAGELDEQRALYREKLRRRIAVLTDISARLTVDAELPETLQVTCQGLVDGTQACAAWLMVLDEQDRIVATAEAGAMPDGYVGAVGELWAAGWRSQQQAETVGDAMHYEPDGRGLILASDEVAPMHPIVEGADFRGLLLAPLDPRGRDTGAVTLLFPPDATTPSEDERAFVRAAVDQAAAAVVNTRLLSSSRDAAALAERQRLARELHDSVSQALYGIALGARTARTLVEEEPARAVEPLDYVLSLAEAGLAEMRALIFELRPEALAEEGLVAALERQLTALGSRHGLTTCADLRTEPDVPLAAKEALYRIAQEATHNVVKHARADSVEVVLRANGNDVVLKVADDGVGFDPDGRFPGHLGLQSMRERAAAVGGAVEVASTPGSGTRVTVRIPVEGDVP